MAKKAKTPEEQPDVPAALETAGETPAEQPTGELPVSEPVAPKPRRVAARIAKPTVPKAIVRPKIIGGVCEFHGQSPAECEHYAGMEIFCSYCGKGPEVLSQRTVNVYSLPETPHEYIFVCSDYSCQTAHHKKFVSPLV